jgi:hypothetical protein
VLRERLESILFHGYYVLANLELRNREFAPPPVVTVRVAPVPRFLIVTFASATRAPLASVTVPCTSPVKSAKTGIAKSQVKKIAAKKHGTFLRI